MLSRVSRAVAVAAAVATGALSFVAGSASASPSPTIVAHTMDASASGLVVVGIGDSILAGHGLAPDQAWLAVLAAQYGWRLTNLASDGSGFVTVGNNGDTFADQVTAAEQLHPDVVIISGSSNDLGADDATIESATTATIDAVHAALPGTRIIAVSAVWGDTALPAQMNGITADVAAATIADGGTYLDIGQPLSGRPALMQSDDDHPTVEGQLALASAVAAAMTTAKVTL